MCDDDDADCGRSRRFIPLDTFMAKLTKGAMGTSLIHCT
jgi:hypothetical protein